ncbi:hypothetical protein CC80DRAFT_547737 [Byssothecium circinans]|uniref:cutinase n=1 Tax=Byssothecium circinans TaxID=147558 RepID=A0A6A5TXH1_9PLEO|nr:hypothetical protein CC80DRAFT_547737 [Byssothecium circinans]
MKPSSITAVTATFSLTAAAPASVEHLAKRHYRSSAYNQLTVGTACYAVSIIYARGTTQRGNGAQLVHNAAQKTSVDNAAKVAAIAVFGNPKRGQSFGSITSSETLTICHSSDNIREGGTAITAAHLSYQNDVTTAGTLLEKFDLIGNDGWSSNGLSH